MTTRASASNGLQVLKKLRPGRPRVPPPHTTFQKRNACFMNRMGLRNSLPPLTIDSAGIGSRPWRLNVTQPIHAVGTAGARQGRCALATTMPKRDFGPVLSARTVMSATPDPSAKNSVPAAHATCATPTASATWAPVATPVALATTRTPKGIGPARNARSVLPVGSGQSAPSLVPEPMWVLHVTVAAVVTTRTTAAVSATLDGAPVAAAANATRRTGVEGASTRVRAL